MEGSEFRRLLSSIGNQIRVLDLQNMKYLCHDKVEAGELERAQSAIDFFNLLLNRQLIGPSNLGFLEDLLDKSERKDLLSRVRSSGRDADTEGPSSGPPRRAVTPDTKSLKRYRVFLNQLCDELTSKDIESFKFLVNVPAAIGQNIKSGHELFDFLEKRGQIGPSDLSCLSDNFECIHRKDLSIKVKEFSEKELVPRMETMTISEDRRREPTVHSERVVLTPISPSTPLLPPQHFLNTSTLINLPATVPPTIPIVAIGPRYPVQCGDDLPPLDEEDIMPSYCTTKRPRGIALIFSNKTFTGSSNLLERTGTERDVENLKNLWVKLNFEVVVKTDQTASEMYNIAREYSSYDHTSYDCFVCCLLSHGVHGGIYGSDSELLELGLITSQFKGTACRSLLDKPKLFFIQACRGKEFDSGAQADAVRNSEEDALRHSAEPNEGHFLLGYATPPGYVSWRSMEHGSWYISKLCEVFSKYCEDYDVTSMMVKVNDEVSEAYTKKGYKQCPAPVVTLRKRIYFNNN